MIANIAALAFGLLTALMIVFFVTTQSKSADLDGDWQLEELTCEELEFSYYFEIEGLQQLVDSYNTCQTYAKSPDSESHSKLYCALLKLEGVFIERMTNAFATEYALRCELLNEEPQYKIDF